MKPINLDNSPCNPVSSNCVIWQGPNIPCIKLCTGDTVTDVVYELAKQLCTILDQVNISTVDLSCLKLTTGKPTDIKALLQILIDKICALNNVPAAPASLKRGASDTIVPVAACLQTNNQTTMKLTDYVQLIGNKICSILNDITNINSSITNLTTRVIALEATSEYTLPSFKPDCTLANDLVESGTEYQLDVILTALVNDNNHGYCALISNVGQPGDIYQAFTSQTVIGNDGALSNCYQTLNQLYDTTWINTPQNLSQSFIDLWLVVKDIRDAYKRYNVVSGSSNVTVIPTTTPGTCGPEVSYAISVDAKGVLVTDTSSINLTITSDTDNYTITANVNDTGWVDLLGFDWFVNSPTWKPQCRRIGNVIYFRGTLMIPLQDNTGAVINYSYGSTDSYVQRTEVTPYTGAGGVLNDPNGAIYFNGNSSVIPSSVIGSGTNIDRSIFSSNYIIASRYFNYKTSTGALSSYSGILHSVCKIFIYADKRMALQILRDNEESAGGSSFNPIGTSALNSLVSRVTVNELSPRWYATDTGVTGSFTNFHSSPTAGTDTQKVFYADNLRFPFTCDAGTTSNLGGFGWIQLEGMTATLAPCNTDIKNNECP